MTCTTPLVMKTARIAGSFFLALMNLSFAQSEAEPEIKLVPMPSPAWTKDIQRFDDELGALVSKAKVPSAKTLDDSDETEAITDGYGGYVDFDAGKGTLQYLANEKVKNRTVEWEFELQSDAEKTYDDHIVFAPKIGKKQVIDGKELMLGYLNAIVLSDAKVGPFKAGDRIRLKATIDDFSRFRKNFELATGLATIYHLEGAPYPIFWLKLAKAEVIHLPAKKPGAVSEKTLPFPAQQSVPVEPPAPADPRPAHQNGETGLPQR